MRGNYTHGNILEVPPLCPSLEICSVHKKIFQKIPSLPTIQAASLPLSSRVETRHYSLIDPITVCLGHAQVGLTRNPTFVPVRPPEGNEIL